MSYMGKEPKFGQFPVERFSGNGVLTSFTLSQVPATNTSLLVTISGVKQQTSAYSVTDTALDFGAGNAPPTGTNNIEVVYMGQRALLGGVADDAVATAKIAANAVTPAKMADSAFLANRNMVINGAMQISQRATSKAALGTGVQTVDRWYTTKVNSGTWTQTQDAGAVSTAGFGYSLKNDCTTALASLAASDRLMMSYRFEGLNCQHLKKGTASAESLTISFWVNATKTGTYVLELYDHDNSRHICSLYTVSVTNTWEYKTITFAGDTTGALDNDNVKSLELQFYLAAGSSYQSGTLATTWAASVGANRAVGQVNAADSTSNNFSLAGVQMEVGITATPFENKTYGQELLACQRYFRILQGYTGAGRNTGSWIVVSCPIAPEMRAIPSITINDDNTFEDADGTAIVGDTLSNMATTSKGFTAKFGVSGTAPQAHRPYVHSCNSSSGTGYSKLDAEM